MTQSIVDNAADQSQVDKAKKAVKFDEKLARKDMEELLKIPAFKRFVWRYLGLTLFLERAFTGEALSSAHNDGMREIGKILFDEVMAVDPNAYVEMLKDSIKRSEK